MVNEYYIEQHYSVENNLVKQHKSGCFICAIYPDRRLID